MHSVFREADNACTLNCKLLLSHANRAFKAVRLFRTAGAGWLWVTALLVAVGVFSRPYFAPQGAKSGALENATVCRLKFAVANFPRLSAGRLATPNDGKP